MAWPHGGFGRVINITSSAVKAPIDVFGFVQRRAQWPDGLCGGRGAQQIASQGVTINNLLPGKFDTDRLATTMQAACHQDWQKARRGPRGAASPDSGWPLQERRRVRRHLRFPVACMALTSPARTCWLTVVRLRACN